MHTQINICCFQGYDAGCVNCWSKKKNTSRRLVVTGICIVLCKLDIAIKTMCGAQCFLCFINHKGAIWLLGIRFWKVITYEVCEIWYSKHLDACIQRFLGGRESVGKHLEPVTDKLILFLIKNALIISHLV